MNDTQNTYSTASNGGQTIQGDKYFSTAAYPIYNYKVNWDLVTTLEDLKIIIKAFDPSFSEDSCAPFKHLIYKL